MADESAYTGQAPESGADLLPAAGAPAPLPEHPSAPLPLVADDDEAGWAWPPYAPLEPADVPRFDCEEWAPSSAVRRPLVRLGRWTLLYRRR